LVVLVSNCTICKETNSNGAFFHDKRVYLFL